MWQGKTSISSLRICGGANTGVGNVASNPGAEGNFMYDPEAAHIVFSVTLK